MKKSANLSRDKVFLVQTRNKPNPFINQKGEKRPKRLIKILSFAVKNLQVFGLSSTQSISSSSLNPKISKS